MKIVVVGAGIAGLAAASHLIEKGFEVTVLEARNRAGGRVWSAKLQGVPVDRGAAWIHGVEGNPITALAQRFHAKLAPVAFSSFSVFDQDGQKFSEEELDRFEEDFEEKLNEAKDFALASEKDLSLAEALARFYETEELTPRELALFKRKLGFFEGYIGAGYEKLSARHWDHEVELSGGNSIVINSYQPIIEGLAKVCDLRLNTVVTAINETAEGILLTTQKENFYADAVLVTVSLGLLKKKTISFTPPLPETKQQAIERLGMGLLNITALKFPKTFWPEACPAFYFAGAGPLSASTFVNLHPFNQQSILIGYSGGDKALKAEHYSDQELLTATLTTLEKQFGKLPEPEACFFTRWSQDPFSLGSYSYMPVGACEEDIDELAKPASRRLFFAGEATNRDFPATTHGAYWSGIREAERIIVETPLQNIR